MISSSFGNTTSATIIAITWILDVYFNDIVGESGWLQETLLVRRPIMLTMPVTMVSTLMEILPSCLVVVIEELLSCVSSSQESWLMTPTLTSPPQLLLRARLMCPEAEEDTEMVLADREDI